VLLDCQLFSRAAKVSSLQAQNKRDPAIRVLLGFSPAVLLMPA
jgi:hypothetical protein